MKFIREKSKFNEMPQARRKELRAMIFVAIVLLFGLFSIYQVKTLRPISFTELSAKMKVDENSKGSERRVPEITNLNELRELDEMVPHLIRFEDESDRNFAAEKLLGKISQNRGEIDNVGFLTSIRVTKEEIENAKDLDYFQKSLSNVQERAEKRSKNRASFFSINGIRNFFFPPDETIKVKVLSNLGSIKNSFIVRTPSEFFTSFLFWSFVFFASFFGLHIFWRLIKFEGDGLILPPIFLLCGIGFLMMISMRDPLRDSLMFADFAIGVAFGCLVILLVSLINYQQVSLWIERNIPNFIERKFPKFSDWLFIYLPIVIAMLLSLTLIFFGSTPGISDAKINLNIGISVQPSEIIKILFSLFVASYFADRWENFRYREKKISTFLNFSLPRWQDILIITALVGVLLLLFFGQKDLGPALMMAGLFLVLFAVVRKRVGLSIAGFLAIIGGYIINYKLRWSGTAADRLEIWQNPWDTNVSGGDQIVQSLWSFATGGFSGTGLGLGDAYFAPAHHTDLILASVGEELGFIGLLLVFAAYSLIFYRCFIIAKNTFSPFAYFLVIGLAVINALQLLFISAGVLGIIPLSGIVAPFLSYGKSSMICNLLAFGIILAVSDQEKIGNESSNSNEKKKWIHPLIAPTKYLAYGLLILASLVLVKAFIVQVWSSNEILVKGVLAPVGNETIAGNYTTGIRRYSYNPRIYLARKQLPIGTIYDRNGIPLASSNWEELNEFAEKYENLGIILNEVCTEGRRCYPFGNNTFHLLGDAGKETNWGASNTNYIEQDYQNVLRGYDDYAERLQIKVKQQLAVRDEDGNPIVDPETKQPQTEEREIDLPIEKKDYKELLPIINNRYNPINISANLMKFKNRNIKTSIDIRLQLRLTEILKTELATQNLKKGAIVVLEPKTGDLLASVSFPILLDDISREEDIEEQGTDDPDFKKDSLLDRARVGVYPPGSTFKIVTGMAAMRKEQDAASKPFLCKQLPNGRIGNVIKGREVKDDIQDKIPHGNITFQDGLMDSCNAYFAQLGNDVAGAVELFKTSQLFGIEVAKPNTATELNKYLPQSSFGQGEIVASPFQIAKVSATVANGGQMQFGRWLTDENNERNDEVVQVISPEQSQIIAEAMRKVVTDGTGKSLASNTIAIAGKTGTAENPFGKSHSWFTGFAPYNSLDTQIAFAVLVENGGYGGGIAAKIAGDLVISVQEIGVIK